MEGDATAPISSVWISRITEAVFQRENGTQVCLAECQGQGLPVLPAVRCKEVPGREPTASYKNDLSTKVKVFPPALQRYKWQKNVYVFRVYNLMI